MQMDMQLAHNIISYKCIMTLKKLVK